MRLSDLKTGEKGIIVKVLGHGGFRKRIVEMGFIHGKEIEVLLNAPLQDPVKYKIMGYEISLRHDEAQKIEVVAATNGNRAKIDLEGKDDDDAIVVESSEPDEQPLSAEHLRAEAEKRHKTINVALVGNPNCGKTSLFNFASGAHERVGNYSGVTVDAKEGHAEFEGYQFNLVDLPGTYSLSAYSPEELYVRKQIIEKTPDVVINVIDTSNLERNLYLTTQLIDMHLRMVCALNMFDETEKRGDKIDHQKLGELFGVPMVPTVFKTGRGVEDLFHTIIQVYESREGDRPAFRHIHINHGHEIENGIAIYTMDTATKWDGKSDISTAQLKEIDIEDLLPRDEIEIDLTAIEELLKDKSILITGSAGSIGSEIVKQIAEFGPRQLVLIDQAETPQHDCRLMMANQYPDIKAETIVASICNKRHMEALFRKYRPDYVFHAAAYKHVPMMEDNPCESIQNNVEGTEIIADLAVKYNVKKFVMISTDKAVNPTNVMGCSKRICEIYVQSLDKAIKEGRHEGQTQFVTTRFGNVLGSNGSVIPLFREQIKNGGPVTVTHPDIIRYFMLIPEACKLVLEAGTMGEGGEIFVFDMGAPVKIADLAKRMIKLSGAKNIEIKYTGLRDGEKLYEEVLNDQEITIPTHHEKIKVAKVREYNFDEVKQQIDQLIIDSYLYDDMATVAGMKKIVPEYVSNHSVYEKLDKQTGIPA